VRDVLTDTQGYWSARVEPGAYRVIATPSSELPWAVQLVNVYDRSEVPNLELTDGRKVSGQVYYPTRDGQRREIAGATVTVYRQPTSASVMPLKLYEALTDRQGRFEVVLPKSPETTRGY
jgi:hypothetical protein